MPGKVGRWPEVEASSSPSFFGGLGEPFDWHRETDSSVHQVKEKQSRVMWSNSISLVPGVRRVHIDTAQEQAAQFQAQQDVSIHSHVSDEAGCFRQTIQHGMAANQTPTPEVMEPAEGNSVPQLVSMLIEEEVENKRSRENVEV
ncbi:hypothetical protein V6N13_095962 [Hibiscus sabdariffa]